MIPKVSVLMTVYNGERHLRECMDSVLNQTFKEFEFLIIDDMSQDASLDIIKSYDDNRIHIMENKENLGQIRSLNIGLNYAQGEYIVRMDQDDVMMKDRLKIQSCFLERRRDIAVAGTWCEAIDEKGYTFDRSYFPTTNGEIIGTILFGGYCLLHPSVIFRKDAALEAGGYDESFSYAEDYNLWTRLLLKRYKIANIPKFLIKFRHHRESSSKRFPEIQLKSAHKSLRNFIRIIDGGCCDSDLDRVATILICAGMLKDGYWLNEKDALHLKEDVALLEVFLKNTIGYFNFKRNEISLMKRAVCNAMLNFAYRGFIVAKEKSRPLYSFCLRNYPYLFNKPKLYLYPVKAIL
jgi:glycosyltransferase involved in cell wall biosynthesis